MKYKIRINPVAISDVQEIKAYISEGSPEVAEKFVNTLYSKIEKLSDFPERGISLSPKIKMKTNYRDIICGSYLIFYKIKGEYVYIYRILHGARKYLSILFTDDLRDNKE